MGVIFLLIQRMTAVFGKLQGHTLELRDGLNIIQAPNETGKSTWCAFLSAMLYGINSRERDRAGFIAEKNRYAPWSGSAMSGRLECRTESGDLTVTRATKRQTSPMGDFHAMYTGTGDAVPGLTGQNCGEALLGVSREVFERSAFIRQAGLPISQDPGLERRIAALISSGEEDTSYIEAADALKKQLNRRRHNKTGLLPTLEAELLETEQQLSEAQLLEEQLTDSRTQISILRQQEAALVEELSLHDRWEACERQQLCARAETAARTAREKAEALRQQLEADQIPGNDTIGRLRGAIVNLETVRKSVERARTERDDAMKALLRAEAAVNESAFAGQTAESARREAQAAPSDKVPSPVAVRELAIFFLFLAGAVAAAFLVISRSAALSSPLPRLLLPWIVFAVVTAAGGVLSRLYRRHALEKLRNTALLKRFGTTDRDVIAALADTYIKLLEARDDAQAAVNAKSASAEALHASLTSNEQGILLEVRRFAPAAFDIPAADQLLRSCAVRRKELADAESDSREAHMRHQILQQQTPAVPEAPPHTPPTREQDAVLSDLEQVRSSLAAARSSEDRLIGRLHALENPAVLQSQIQHLSEQREQLESDYAAIQLSLEALDGANITLQNRFSPALGRRAAEIFSQLTGGRYSGVVLDRAFHLAAEPSGDSVYRDAALLSAGATDQLYLAVRLAICELVLPAEKHAPIILDDALASFDDERCAAALRWLKEAARERQILLFTCHSRESDFFREDPEVLIEQLTDSV